MTEEENELAALGADREITVEPMKKRICGCQNIDAHGQATSPCVCSGHRAHEAGKRRK